MLGKRNQSAVLAKYLSLYKKNPRSKVFAPLAESFRKLGMLDDAYKILKDGIRHHPNYVLGYIVLANCYFDQDKFDLTYNTLRPIIGQNADNVSLQKLFAQACMNLGHLEEALDTYKYLLFMNPRDKFFIDQVKKLEDDLMIGHKKLSLEQLIKAPNLERLGAPAAPTVDDDWVQVDFNRKSEVLPEEFQKDQPPAVDEDKWVIEKQSLSEHPLLKEKTIITRDLEDDFFADEFTEHGEVEEGPLPHSETPIISHTLIDLYCAQKYFDKAIELLNKILELNPGDGATLKKLAHVKTLKEENTPKISLVPEEAGHEELISIIESKVKIKSKKETQLQQVFDQFLVALQQRAQVVR